MIPVTKPYLPSREKLNRYIDGIYERGWLTNNGELVKELTKRLEEYLGVENLLLVANGTLALQIAFRTLGISNLHENAEAITTPFTFIATASALKWEGIEPVFADIEPNTWCLDPNFIESCINSRTQAIVPVHVFGNACNVEEIDVIAKRNKLKVVYDASHAFGVNYKSESLLKHGDAATLSFHATKIFHTGEGGAIVFKKKEDLEIAKQTINFGMSGPDAIHGLGINAKMSELHAAMGLCVLDELEYQLNNRMLAWNYYYNKLRKENIIFQNINSETNYNYAYFPCVLKSSATVDRVINELKKHHIIARKYFHPSLEKVGFLGKCKISQKEEMHSTRISERIVCLPIFSSITRADQDRVIHMVKQSI